MRIDLLLVKKNLVPTRTKAQDMIKNGQVFVVVDNCRKMVLKVSEDFPETAQFEITSGFATEFVSRAGHKIKGASEFLNLSFKNKICLDVGVSTGGFSDFMLRAGASRVIGIDVGQDQTHSSLKNDSRFMLLEKVNARYLHDNQAFQHVVPKTGFDFICMDVSFISMKLILPELFPLLDDTGQILVLIKPQFELGPDALNERGVVKDSRQYVQLEKSMVEAAEKMGFVARKYFPSSIEGKDGNKEFFLFLSKNRG